MGRACGSAGMYVAGHIDDDPLRNAFNALSHTNDVSGIDLAPRWRASDEK
jgi:hypothetical protein